MEEIRVRVVFTIEDFTDALYYTLEEWSALTDFQKEEDKRIRYENYLASLQPPEEVVEEEG